LGERRAGSA